MTIAVDFDGTIVVHKFPEIGEEVPGAIDTLKRLKRDGHKLILWTAREGKLLEEAIAFCKERGLTFYSANSNFPEDSKFKENKGFSTKILADLYIDDHNLGGLPDWETIYEMITDFREQRRKRRKLGFFARLRKRYSK